MKPWDIVIQRNGCLTVLATLCAGTLLGYVLYWQDDANNPYIDQATAIRYALENTHDICIREHQSHPVDCTYSRARVENENRDGWFFTLTLANGTKGQGMIVDRRGASEPEGPNGAYDIPQLGGPPDRKGQ